MRHNGYVQFGCGLCAPQSWTNFDASPTLRLQKVPVLGPLLARNMVRFPKNGHYGDIIRGLPIEPESCAAIYCSHVLEHLSLNDLRKALKNTFIALKPGGIFRFVLPDLELIAKEYVNSTSDQPAMAFMESSLLGYNQRPRGPAGMLREWIGNSRHLWMWDYRSLSKELEAAGFVGIRRASYGDSDDPRFADVEELGRWENNLGIECRKPL